MTTLQEAARDALEALERIGKDFVCRSAHHAKKDQHSAFAECPVVVRHTDAIESLRTALAQQVERKNCPQPEICGSKECEFCRDTAAPAQQPVAYITPTEQGSMVWTQEMYDEACTYCDDGEFPVPLYTAAPAPQAQDVPEVGFGNMQSAQPVAQPLAKTCDTCAHYQQGKHPGVSIYDETCYICREYYANKWEAKSE